jgi:hypothetical protein
MSATSDNRTRYIEKDQVIFDVPYSPPAFGPNSWSKEPWIFCPDCGIGPGEEHKAKCPRASWNLPRYRCRTV